MTIQINTDKNSSIQEAFSPRLDQFLAEELSRFSEHITRLEVHLSDENGSKERFNDKKCLLEACLEDRMPIRVRGSASTYDLAINSAIERLKTSLDNVLGQISIHNHGKYFYRGKYF
ncbi:MAG: HPF/RaiA family ribosome-associated protein [Crocinitomicaceae bacterium]